MCLKHEPFSVVLHVESTYNAKKKSNRNGGDGEYGVGSPCWDPVLLCHRIVQLLQKSVVVIVLQSSQCYFTCPLIVPLIDDFAFHQLQLQ